MTTGAMFSLRSWALIQSCLWGGLRDKKLPKALIGHFAELRWVRHLGKADSEALRQES